MNIAASVSVRTPRPSADEIRRQLGLELSSGQKVVHTCLFLGAVTMAVAISALWLTETGLPLRTHLAFGAIVAGALSWAAVLGRTLLVRRIPFAHHRLLAARVAVAWSAFFVIAAATLGVATPEMRPGAFAAAALGAPLVALALWLLRRASRRYRELATRRDDLERELAALDSSAAS